MCIKNKGLARGEGGMEQMSPRAPCYIYIYIKGGRRGDSEGEGTDEAILET